jgi:hypothetical protein
MPEQVEWITLYHPGQQATHRVPDNPLVISHFIDRGWETPDDTAARVEAEAVGLHGKELNDRLDAAGLSKGGTVKEKQARLAEFEAAQEFAEAESATTEEEQGSDNG